VPVLLIEGELMLKKLTTLAQKFFSVNPAKEIKVLDAEEIEELRTAFKKRYASFKLLLISNQRVLEVLADMEKALQGDTSFSMSFVQSNSTKVSVNVFRMIDNMEVIAPGKYSCLKDSFMTIKQNIDVLLGAKKVIADKRLVLPLEEIDVSMLDLAGGKMANLGEVKNRLKMEVPDGFVVTAAAHEMFMTYSGLQQEVDRLFQISGADEDRNLDLVGSQIRQLIMAAELPEPIQQAVNEAYSRIMEKNGGRDLRMALRSSAHGEDAENSSFAGQYRSELNVDFSNFFYYYKQIIASKYSVQAISYKINRGFKDEDIAMCVGCLAMVDAVAGGVIYTGNPLDSQDNAIFINSTWGLPKAVVDGEDLCDLFVVLRGEPLTIHRREIREKKYQVLCDEEDGCTRTPTDTGLAGQPSLTDEQVRNLADQAIRIEEHYKSPQDIEWAIDRTGKICILQSRPLQQSRKVLPQETLDLSDYESSLIAADGIDASPGVACGKVYKASKKVDIILFPEGAVLVVEQALPSWAPLIARSAAVISEQGGFAGHLANVAREFGVPALFGVKEAMTKLRTDDIVTVAADLGRVYLGRIDALLQWTCPKQKPMIGSPIYETLQAVSRHIIPLNLLDPEALDFTPENCLTFHDITRFIHEKSVQEMFDFGKDHSFPERSGKQLHYQVPMNWWVLNLDDGFHHEIHGRYVKLEDIASIPMLAFWEGFTAVPWDGPPAIDGAGMASILFQSAINPALASGVPAKYAERNYFMVSRHYCSLNSHMGYHFSTMEAMISEQSEENYLGFKFKGGAADFERCLGRVNLIQEMLEHYGFRVAIATDNLDARIEGFEMEFMKGRLKILGYLTDI